MVLFQTKAALKETEVQDPEPAEGEVLVRVNACAVCRTDLHVIDGELPNPRLPLVPGHEIVGRVAARGKNATRFRTGDRVGIPWLARTCGVCMYCKAGTENLCDQPQFTGYTHDGGYAGLIGFRSLVRARDARHLGIYGFGAAAHLIAQVAVYQGRDVFAFTRAGDQEGQQFARSLGAVWAGSSSELPPVELDAAIIFAPVGTLVPHALRAVRKGGIVVCGGIHMSDIPQFPYALLWGEREICSVANLTRKDAADFMAIAPKVPVRSHFELFPLKEANEALERLRSGRLRGAAVLVPQTVE